LRKRQPREKQQVVAQYLAALATLVPEAEGHREDLFGDLLASLKSGQNVQQHLADFVLRAKTPSVKRGKPGQLRRQK